MKNLIKKRGRYYTKNLNPGISVYGEKLIRKGKNELREWDARRSKLGAGLRKGLRLSLKDNSSILYLGAASGTTVSHVSDLVPKGVVFSVEFAPEPMKHLVMLAKQRNNIIPLFNNANLPEEYSDYIKEKVDLVFQDVAQRNQVDIFSKNCKRFLKRNGTGLLTVKSRSIDVTKKPHIVFKEVEKKIRKKFKIIKSKRLEPFEKDHKLYALRMK